MYAVTGQAIQNFPTSRTLIICHSGDNICAQHGQTILLQHLTYAQNAAQAARFVAAVAGLAIGR